MFREYISIVYNTFRNRENLYKWILFLLLYTYSIIRIQRLKLNLFSLDELKCPGMLCVLPKCIMLHIYMGSIYIWVRSVSRPHYNWYLLSRGVFSSSRIVLILVFRYIISERRFVVKFDDISVSFIHFTFSKYEPIFRFPDRMLLDFPTYGSIFFRS